MIERSTMSPDEIAAWPAYRGDGGETPHERARRLMRKLGLWSPAQAYGRRWGVGCIAVEITQRCNLDCGLCYLSDSSEALKDLPLPEVLRRLDDVRCIYGEGTDVQITGGDPTLRDHDELVAIVRHAAAIGLRPALFTNGIRATRELLARLASAGLVDVAFHVDTTQNRKGYDSEVALNALRDVYVERARGLGLNVIFNTSLHTGNVGEVRALVRYFFARAGTISFASFQLQAATGRGVLGSRPETLTPAAICAAIDAALAARLSWDFPLGGHPACNRYACVLAAGQEAFDLYRDRPFLERMLEEAVDVRLDRRHRLRSVATLLRFWMARPGLWLPGLRWAGRLAWRMRRGLWRGRGRVEKVSFFVHNFMDACKLERDRIEACAFMVATADGMRSMCLVNAQRDRFLLPPIRLHQPGHRLFWDPVTGATSERAHAPSVVQLSRKTAKGRARARFDRTDASSTGW
ncbi:MAG: radical SAM protein [Alphaproteobacteria bacterium]|nr:radical SAM protein [Alphaproteobacteria bacterium]MCW5742753.1 radical SAM protein [Alphaproteobacteria bacterium]